MIKNTTEYNQMQVYFVHTDIYTTRELQYATSLTLRYSIYTSNISEIEMHLKIDGMSV